MKRLISIILTLAIVIGIIQPIGAWADTGEEEGNLVYSHMGMRQLTDTDIQGTPNPSGDQNDLSRIIVKLPMKDDAYEVQPDEKMEVKYFDADEEELDPIGNVEFLWLYDSSFNSDVDSICPIGISLETWKTVAGDFVVSDVYEDDYSENLKTIMNSESIKSEIESMWTSGDTVPVFTSDQFDLSQISPEVYEYGLFSYMMVIVRWRASENDDWSLYGGSTACPTQIKAGNNVSTELFVNGQSEGNLVKTPASTVSEYPHMYIDLSYIGDLYYQWYKSNTDSYNGIAIEGATSEYFSTDAPDAEGVHDYYYCVVNYPDIYTGEAQYWYSKIFDVYFSNAQGIESLSLVPMEFYQGNLDNDRYALNLDSDNKFYIYNYYNASMCTAVGDEGTVSCYISPQNISFKDETCDYLSYAWYKSETSDYKNGGILLESGEVHDVTEYTNASFSGTGLPDYGKLNQHANIHVTVPAEAAGSYYLTVEVTVHKGDSTNTTMKQTKITVVENQGELYDITSDGAVTAYHGLENEIEIPEVINGITVKKLDAKFTQYSSFEPSRCGLKKIVLSEGLEIIDGSALRLLVTLEEIVFPSTLNEIGDYAFEYTGLKSVTFNPDSFPEKLGNYAFKNCGFLEKITMPQTAVGTVTGVGTFESCTKLESINNFNNLDCENLSSNFYNTPVLEKILLSSAEDGMFYYSKNEENNGWVIIGRLGTQTELIIPDSFNGLPVTEIGASAFERVEDIEKVTLGDNIVKIGNKAFYGCTNLVSFDTADAHVKSIGKYAFAYDYNLASHITIKSGCVVDEHAFFRCYSITEVTLEESVLKHTSFDWCVNIEKINGETSNIVTITADGKKRCFGNFLMAKYFDITEQSSEETYQDEKLTGGTFSYLPITYYRVGNIAYAVRNDGKWYAEYYLDPFSSDINIPGIVTIEGDDVKAILGEFLFEYLLTDKWNIIIENGIEDILSYGYGKIYKFRFPETAKSFTKKLFYDNLNKSNGSPYLEEVSLPASLTSIPEYAFSRCYFLKKVTFGESWSTPLSKDMFSFCYLLDNVVLPDGITEIPENAFRGCTGLNNITLPNNLKAIGAYAFANTWSLENIDFPETLAKFETRDMTEEGASCAFANSALKTLDLSKCANLTEIPGGTFCGTRYLDKIILGNGITDIKWNAFDKTPIGKEYLTGVEEDIAWEPDSPEEYKAITEITWSDKLEKIGNSAFYNAFFAPTSEEVYVLELPDSLKYIGNKAFSADPYKKKSSTGEVIQTWINNLDLNEGKLPENLQSIGEYAFDYTALSTVVIPLGMTQVGDYAFNYSNSEHDTLTTIILHDGITDIGTRAFSGAHIDLADGKLELPASLKRIGAFAFYQTNPTEYVFSKEIEYIGEIFFNPDTVEGTNTTFVMTVLNPDGVYPVIDIEPTIIPDIKLKVRCYKDSAAYTWAQAMLAAYQGTEREGDFSIELLDEDLMLRLYIKKADGTLVGESELESVKWYDETINDGKVLSTQTSLGEGVILDHKYSVDVQVSKEIRLNYLIPKTLSLTIDASETNIAEFTMPVRETIVYTGSLPQLEKSGFRLAFAAMAGEDEQVYAYPAHSGEKQITIDEDLKTFRVEIPRIETTLSLNVTGYNKYVLNNVQYNTAVDGVVDLGVVETEPALRLEYPVDYVPISKKGGSIHIDFNGTFKLYNKTKACEIKDFSMSSSLVLFDSAKKSVSIGDELELTFVPKDHTGIKLDGSVTIIASSTDESITIVKIPVLLTGYINLSVFEESGNYRWNTVYGSIFDEKGENITNGVIPLGGEYTPGKYTALFWSYGTLKTIPDPDYFERNNIDGRFWKKVEIDLESDEDKSIEVKHPDSPKFEDDIHVEYSLTADNIRGNIEYVPIYFTFNCYGDLTSQDKTFVFTDNCLDMCGFVEINGNYAYLLNGGEVSAVLHTPDMAKKKAYLTITTSEASGTICLYARPLGQRIDLTEVSVGDLATAQYTDSIIMPLYSYEVIAPAENSNISAGNLQLFSASDKNSRALVYVDDELCSDVFIEKSAVRKSYALPYSFETYDSVGIHTIQVVIVYEDFNSNEQDILDLMVDEDSYGNTIYYYSDVFSVLYDINPIPEPLTLIVSNGLKSTDSESFRYKSITKMDFVKKTVDPLVFTIGSGVLNNENKIANDFVFDYHLTMSHPELVDAESVSLDVYCGENFTEPIIHNVKLIRNQLTGDFEGTLTLKGGTVSVNEMPYYVDVKYGYVRCTDIDDINTEYLAKMTEQRKTLWESVLKTSEEEKERYDSMRVDMDEIELIITYLCYDFTDEEKQNVREFFVEGNQLADNYDQMVEDLANSGEAIQLIANDFVALKNGVGVTSEKLIMKGAQAIEYNDRALYMLYEEDSATVYDLDNDCLVKFELDADIDVSNNYNTDSYGLAATSIINSDSTPSSSRARKLADSTDASDDESDTIDMASITSHKGATLTVKEKENIRDSYVLPGLDAAELIVQELADKAYTGYQLKLYEDVGKELAEIEKLSTRIKEINELPNGWGTSKFWGKAKEDILKSIADHNKAIEDIKKNGPKGKIFYPVLKKVGQIISKLKAAAYSPSTAAEVLKEATRYSSSLFQSKAFKVIGSVIMVAFIINDAVNLVSNYFSMINESEKNDGIIAILAEDMVKCGYAYKEKYGYYFKDYIVDKDKQMKKAEEIYREFYDDLEEEFNGYLCKLWSSYLALVSDLTSVVTTIALPKKEATIFGLGATIVSSYSSAFSDAKLLKNYLEIDKDWDIFIEEVRDPVDRHVENGKKDPDTDSGALSAASKKNGMPIPFKLLIDPAGYAYEAVSSNRVEGVTARVYYRDSNTGEAVYWDEADYYGEINPQYTGEDGTYSWFTPAGQWLVCLEKDGYEKATSENDPAAIDGWLPVPPPQLDVNISMISTANPEIEDIKASPDGVKIKFSQYMDIDSLDKASSLLRFTMEGLPIAYDYYFEDAEESPEYQGVYYGQILVLTVRDGKLPVGKHIKIEIDKGIKNYAGKELGKYKSDDIEVKQHVGSITCVQDSIETGIGKEVSVVVLVKDTSGNYMQNVKVNAITENGTITVNKSSITDDNGCAKFTLNGISIGDGSIRFSVEDYTDVLMTRVSIQPEVTNVERKLIGIKIATSPDKTEYVEGEKFDPTGMKILGIYSDQSSSEITGYTYTPKDNLIVEDTEITINYTESGSSQSAIITIIVNHKAFENPSGTPEPTPEPGISGTPEPTPEPGISSTPEPTPETGISGTPVPTPEPGISSTPELTPNPDISSTPEPVPGPDVSSTPLPIEKLDSNDTPTPIITPGATQIPSSSVEVKSDGTTVTTTITTNKDGSSCKQITKVSANGSIKMTIVTEVPVIEEDGEKSVKKTKFVYTVTEEGKAKLVKVTTDESEISIPAIVTINGTRCRVVTIGKKAFKGNTSITKVVLGKYVETIGTKALAGLKNLKEITISSSKLSKVSKGAFSKISKEAKFYIKAKKSVCKSIAALITKSGVKKV